MNIKDKLKNIREQRKKGKKPGKNQKRKVEVIEYEDGTFSLIGYAYDLPLQRDEVEHAFGAWLDKSLEKGVK